MASGPSTGDDLLDGLGVRREVPCQGHAFGEDLICPCGVTWFGHQQARRSCPLDAQRGRRPGAPRCAGQPKPPQNDSES